MSPIPESTTFSNEVDPVAAARLAQLASYKSMQAQLEVQRRLQVSRRRLLALSGPQPWGWLAL